MTQGQRPRPSIPHEQVMARVDGPIARLREGTSAQRAAAYGLVMLKTWATIMPIRLDCSYVRFIQAINFMHAKTL